MKKVSERCMLINAVKKNLTNPLTPMSDQDRISPHNVNTISSRQVMRLKKIEIKGLLVDLFSNSPN